MSVEMVSDRVSYVHCNFCNTILVVGVPCSNLLTIATVRCERCSNLLSVNLSGSLPQSLHRQDFQKQKSLAAIDLPFKEIGSSSKCKRLCPMSNDDQATKTSPIRPPEKRQRVPSAYNRFIK
ncbi:hypothetical protein M569_13486 [Genlisea aurea]|uniref:Axial regulator YABBY 2 n=1 Tax=Genlisea aurea TaxID=192259 RepID=S8CAB8_9LAMI|nr:hypothetical protein M569_13486 [Genlisea aurea]